MCNDEREDSKNDHPIFISQRIFRVQRTKSSTHTPSSPMNSPSSWISGPFHPSLNSSILYAHRIKMKRIAKDRNATNTLKRVGNGALCDLVRCALVYLTANSILRAMKTQSVKTWKERPAIATSFAVLLFPLDVEDRAPPIDWRTRENMSQGYGETTESDLRLWGYKFRS